MSMYPEGKRPVCPSKFPGCLGHITERGSKQCANCYDFGRKHQLSKKVSERMVLEDRLVESVTSYLKATPSHVHRLAPAKIKKTHAGVHEMVLLLSDAHFSEVVDPNVAMGIAYNEDIAKRRIERVRDVTIRYKQLRETSYPIRKLTVAVPPWAPRYDRARDPAWRDKDDQYAALIMDAGRRCGFDVLNIQSIPGLGQGNYADEMHVNASGVPIYTRYLVSRLKR